MPGEADRKQKGVVLSPWKGRSGGVCGAGSSLDWGCQTVVRGKFNFRQWEQNTESFGERGTAGEITPAETAAWGRASRETRRRRTAHRPVCVTAKQSEKDSRMGFIFFSPSLYYIRQLRRCL